MRTPPTSAVRGPGRSSTRTSSPRSSSARARCEPTKPWPPVTSARLTRSPPSRAQVRPRRLARGPEVVEDDRVLVGVHAVPEALVPVGVQLAVGGEPLAAARARARCPRRGRRAPPGSKQRKPPLIQCSLRGFSTNPSTRPSSSSSATPHCRCGRTTVTVARPPWPRWKPSSGVEVDVGDAVGVGERRSVPRRAARRAARPAPRSACRRRCRRTRPRRPVGQSCAATNSSIASPR